MKNLTWQNPEQLFVAQELINKVKSKCCGIKDFYIFAQLLHYNNYIIFGIMMNKNQIGTNAGIVWKLLSDNAHWEYDKLKQASGLSDRDLNAAIGWLAREDKIDFDIDEQHDRLFLHVNVYIG